MTTPSSNPDKGPNQKLAPKTPLGVLFVCAGNICRSPLGEGLFLDLIERLGIEGHFRVDSAGTGAWHVGERPDRRSIAVAAKHGFALPGVARQVRRNDFESFDFLLCMDADNEADLHRIAPSPLRGKVHLIRAFDSTAEMGAEVPDPYYGGNDGFEKVYQMLDRACRGFVESLRKEGRLQG